MAEDYLQLTPEDRRDLFEGLRGRSKMNARILEKDIWVCWALDVLFSMPNAPRMAFKGGTSLSKAYNVIQRFSEDIDITVDPDHEDIAPGFDPLDPAIGRNRLKDRGEHVTKTDLPRYARDVLVPYLQTRCDALPALTRPRVAYDPNHPDAVEIRYPTSLEADKNAHPYVAERVLIELGVRATIEPSAPMVITPYVLDIADLADRLTLPTPTVPVLAVNRTFWEKVTLMHYENTRNDGPKPGERFARHLYDLYKLGTHPTIGPGAVNDTEVRDRVIRIKQVHFRGKQVDYEACRTGNVRLVPEESFEQRLERDYNQMCAAGMFFEEPPSFEMAAQGVAQLETGINTANSI